MFDSQHCDICNAKAHTAQLPRRLMAITSTGLPWKERLPYKVCKSCGFIGSVYDEAWRKETAEIYSAYGDHPLGSVRCEEGLVSSPRGLKPRSQAFFEFIQENTKLPENGKLLDFGCGEGNTLRRASGIFLDQWTLYGYEICSRQSSNWDAVIKIPRVADFFTEDPRNIQGTFDLITMVHVLEHVPLLVETLTKIRTNLTSGGCLAVIVPNFKEHPFQMMIADHFSQFTMNSLSLVLARCGYDIILVDDSYVKKELIMLATPAKPKKVTVDFEKYYDPNSYDQAFLPCLNYLSRMIELAEEKHYSSNIGIFGTSISGGVVAWAATGVVFIFCRRRPQGGKQEISFKACFVSAECARGIRSYHCAAICNIEARC